MEIYGTVRVFEHLPCYSNRKIKGGRVQLFIFSIQLKLYFFSTVLIPNLILLAYLQREFPVYNIFE